MRMRHTRMLFQATFVGVLALMAAGPAQAVDGVIEINQAAVFAGGITPGDAPGFPATLSQSGSYRLTGNLDVTKLANGNPAPSPASITAVDVTASNVTLDLNGFTISGPATCTGAPPATQTVCTPFGIGMGVHAGGAGLTVRNGTIRGMGNSGIETAAGTGNELIDGVRAINNAGSGMFVHAGSIVRNCIASSNGGDGISESGLGGVVVTNSVTNFNGAIGINLGGEATVAGNIAGSNWYQGITVNTGSTVIGNTARGNRTAGLLAIAAAGYTNNVFNDNNGGNGNPQVSGGTEMAPNICGGDLTCP